MVQIGELRERVTIEQQSRVSDGAGGATITWAAIASDFRPHARVQPVKGAEITEGGRVRRQQTYLVVIRHRADITVEHRLKWTERGVERILNINSIEDRDMDRRFLWLECVE
ncbi:MAG: phage head closure protein [Sphingomonadales bacterium]